VATAEETPATSLKLIATLAGPAVGAMHSSWAPLSRWVKSWPLVGSKRTRLWLRVITPNLGPPSRHSKAKGTGGSIFGKDKPPYLVAIFIGTGINNLLSFFNRKRFIYGAKKLPTSNNLSFFAQKNPTLFTPKKSEFFFLHSDILSS
jgi:hypothetical protein